MDYLVRKDTGTRIAYEYKKSNLANAETVAFIHGLSFDRHIWDTVLDRFNDHYHILTYDLCGHGDTEPIGGPLTWEFLVNGLMQLLDHLGVESCHIIAHGFGGIIGIKTTIQHMERVRTLTLVSTPLYFPQDVYHYEYETRVKLIEEDFEGFVNKIAKVEVEDSVGENKALIESGIRRVDLNTYLNGVRLIFGNSYTLMEDLPKIKVPTLLMCGDRNPVFPPHYTALYASMISVSRLQIVPNSLNAVFIEQPKLFYDAVMDFINHPPTEVSSPGYRFLMQKMRRVLENAYKSEVAAPLLEVKAIGRFSVKWRGMPLEGSWTRRSAKELLLYLSLHRSVSREELIEAFFTETEADKAKNYLRVMLNHLKSIFESTGDSELINALKVTRGSVNLRCNINGDVAIFLENLKKGFNDGRDPKEMKLDFCPG